MAQAQLRVSEAFFEPDWMGEDINEWPWPEGTVIERDQSEPTIISAAFGQMRCFLISHPDIPEGTVRVCPTFSDDTFLSWGSLKS